MRVKERIIKAAETSDGKEVGIKRLFPSADLRSFDPFVLFDEFFIVPPAGFPEHPHRGFEAVTYMLEGALRHTDSDGHVSVIDTGGVQRITTGKGIEHSEMPDMEGMNHGIQLWINLPERLKKIKPEYQQVDPCGGHGIPQKEDENTITRAVVGPGSPLRVHEPVLFLDVILKARRIYPVQMDETYRGFLYMLSGTVKIEDESVHPGEAFLFETVKNAEAVSSEHARFLLIAGKPLEEPIHLHGSFVD